MYVLGPYLLPNKEMKCFKVYLYFASNLQNFILKNIEVRKVLNRISD